MHYDQLTYRESLLPDDLKLSEPLTQPQYTGEYTLLLPRPGEDKMIRLSPAELKVGSTHLAAEVPRYPLWTSIVLLAISVADGAWQAANVVSGPWKNWLKWGLNDTLRVQ